jgi:hypothetical protein
MRHSDTWMEDVDDRILEYLAGESWASPGEIERALTMTVSRARIRSRLYTLRLAGFVTQIAPKSRHYELTTDGQGYLDGRMRAEGRLDPTVDHSPGFGTRAD